ncbi:MAG TPA: hypothetical protein VN612_08085 [Acidobacteriaceae bacterium]|nr:hypothetical protein [Acidobacteriaceae bacterium]
MNTKLTRRFVAAFGAVAVCGAALCTVPMMAQGGGGGMRMTSDQRVERLDAAVTLTADQKTKVKAIYDADQKKMEDMRTAQDPDMMTKMRAMREDENKQIRALLTPEQQTKFDAMPQGRGRGGMGGGGNAGGGAPPQQ